MHRFLPPNATRYLGMVLMLCAWAAVLALPAAALAQAPEGEVEESLAVENNSDAALQLPEMEIDPLDLPPEDVPPELSTLDPLGEELPEEDPVQEMRDLLELCGVGSSYLRTLRDGRPLHLDEQEALVRILFRLPTLSRASLEGWQLRDVSLAQFAAEPERYRGGIKRVMGRVRSLRRHTLSPEVQERFGFADYYEATLESYDGGRTVRVFARTIPDAWQEFVDTDSPLDEQASALGLFLKEDGSTADPAELIFAAGRIAWHPDRVGGEVTEDDVTVAGLGMDIGLYDDVVDDQQLVAADTECFYQLLSAMRNATPERLGRPRPSLDRFADWLQNPEEVQGELVTVEGVCRQAVEVLVDDPEIQERFGISRYYQLVVFVTPDYPIKMLPPGGEGEPTYLRDYPLVFCVRQLPEGMPQGVEINEPVQITGVYLKRYTYFSERFSRENNRMQRSPLILGLSPRWIREEPAQNPWLGAAIGGAFVALLLVVWLSVWLYGRGDRAFQREVMAKRFAPEGEKSLDDMGIEAAPETDFSHLDS